MAKKKAKKAKSKHMMKPKEMMMGSHMDMEMAEPKFPRRKYR